MLTPLDIQNKEFKKSISGYNSAEVDDFFSIIIESYEKLYKENIDARDQIEVLKKAIGAYKKMEESLQNVLITAQSAGDEVITNAKAKAARIIQDAENKAANIVEQAHTDVKNLTYKFDDIKRSMEGYKTQSMDIINNQIKILDGLKLEKDKFASTTENDIDDDIQTPINMNVLKDQIENIVSASREIEQSTNVTSDTLTRKAEEKSVYDSILESYQK